MDIGKTQFGFRQGLGTREALFTFNVLVQRCLDVSQDVYVCFLDYNKAFDKVRHDQLLNVLKSKHLDHKDLRIIHNLYYNQRARVCVDQQLTDEIKIKRGVRQGCVMSPTLFNAYSEDIVKRALEDETRGIQINGMRVNNIRYADDTVILAECLEDLQIMMDKTARYSEEYGLTLNVKKTKFMKISKRPQHKETLMIQGKSIEQVQKYTYLGDRKSVV